jgi:hypothetical protein
MVIHFRYAVVGKICLNNVHPFLITFNEISSCGMVSNALGGGRFPPTFERGIGMTGSEAVARFIEKKFHPDFFYDELCMNELNNYIGEKCRIVFLDNNGKITIINKKLGIIENDIWYSNDYFRSKHM